jgi:signal transduction histidine kinase
MQLIPQPTPASLKGNFNSLDTNRLVNMPARLDAVRSSALLDSPPEESFDSLVQLATRLIKAPASFISIVDQQRDFYKAQSGFAAPLCDTRELSGTTFCHYTLGNDEPLVINDTHSDPAWKSVSTVETLGVRAYVGFPLQINDQNIGSFCVIDTQPRIWKAEELEMIGQLAQSAARELRLRAAIASAEAALQRSNVLIRSKEQLVAVVAHDLRTPLQILQISTEVIDKKTGGEHSPTVTRMRAALSAMKSMTDMLLSAHALMAPSTAGCQMITASALVADAVDMMAPIAARAGIALQTGEVAPGSLSVDYQQMLRVLGNLIGNAIKYSPAGSVITVGSQRAGDAIDLTVADNGHGMDESAQAKAFERGWQGAEGVMQGDGAGLGLSIVRSLVTQHGGRVALRSAPGQGTTVTISLPGC